MKATRSPAISDVILLEPRFGDSAVFRYNHTAFQQATGLEVSFVQDNHSRSARNVLRGMHYQLAPKAQGKLVRARRRRGFRRRCRYPSRVANLWAMGRRSPLGGQQASALDSSGICARLPGVE